MLPYLSRTPVPTPIQLELRKRSLRIRNLQDAPELGAAGYIYRWPLDHPGLIRLWSGLKTSRRLCPSKPMSLSNLPQFLQTYVLPVIFALGTCDLFKPSRATSSAHAVDVLPMPSESIVEVGAWFPFSPAWWPSKKRVTKVRATPHRTKHRFTSKPHTSGVSYVLALPV